MLSGRRVLDISFIGTDASEFSGVYFQKKIEGGEIDAFFASS